MITRGLKLGMVAPFATVGVVVGIFVGAIALGFYWGLEEVREVFSSMSKGGRV